MTKERRSHYAARLIRLGVVIVLLFRPDPEPAPGPAAECGPSLEPAAVDPKQRSPLVARAWFIGVVVVLLGLAVVFGIAGYTYRPDDTGPPSKPTGALQLVDLVVDRQGVDAATRIGLDSSDATSPSIQIALGIDTGKAPVRWALVLCFDAPVHLDKTSDETVDFDPRAVLPEGGSANTDTYLIEGTTPAGSGGYTQLRTSISTTTNGSDVSPLRLKATDVSAAHYEDPYLTIPVAVGLSDTFRDNGLNSLAPDPSRLLRALDDDVLGWSPNAARTAMEYQGNDLPDGYTPDGVLPPQSAAATWYWDLTTVPRSSANFATARSPSLVVEQTRHVFWSGVYLALAGSALLAVLPLALAWPRREKPEPS